MEQIQFNKSTPIYLYGYNINSELAYTRMKQEDYNIVGIIDKNAENLKGKTNVSAIMSVESCKNFVEFDISVLIICLRDVNKHDLLARRLYELGWKYLVFLPMSNYFGGCGASYLRMAYNCFYSGQYDDILWVPHFKECLNTIFSLEDCIWHQTENMVIAWCHVSLLYGPDYEETLNCANRFQGKKVWPEYNLPLVAQRTFLGLMEFFEHTGNECEYYIESKLSCRGENEKLISKTELLQDRWRGFQKYAFEFQRSRDFFASSALIVRWNKRGYFNVIDGNHRSAFLIQHGFSYLPIKLTRQEYNDWINEPALNLIKKNFLDTQEMETVTPIPHPAFYKIPSQREFESHTLYAELMNYLYNVNLSKTSTLEIGSYQGYFSRHMLRRGIESCVYITSKDTEREKAANWNKLLRLPENVMIIDSEAYLENQNCYKKFGITFLVGEISELNLDYDVVLQIINKMTYGIIIWESEEKPEEEKKLILQETDFKYYHQIRKGFNGKAITEVGIFAKKEANLYRFYSIGE